MVYGLFISDLGLFETTFDSFSKLDPGSFGNKQIKYKSEVHLRTVSRWIFLSFVIEGRNEFICTV